MIKNENDNFSEYQITPWEQVDISNHYMFRLVMENPDLCKIALERILDIKITKLEVLVAEKSIEYKYPSHGIRLDIYAEDDAGVAYDFEMQAADGDKYALGKRTRYYQSLMDGDALKKSTPYSKLRKSYIIFICKFDPFNRNFGYYTFNSWCDQDKNLNLNDGATKILLNTTGNKTGMSEELKNFLEFIDTNSPTDEYTRCLANTVQIIKNDKGAQELYMTMEQRIMEVREQMQQYVVAAEHKAAEADKRADNAELQNITNIIKYCKKLKYTDEQTIEQLIEDASLSRDAAVKVLAEYK